MVEDRFEQLGKDIKGTKTEKNLMEAFAGESQARNKYTYFASKARKDLRKQQVTRKSMQRSGLRFFQV